MIFCVNDSLFVGIEGFKVQFCVICECLMKEVEGNVVLKVEDIDELDVFIVFGCGELLLVILIENMCCEGFEFGVGCLCVVYQFDEQNNWQELVEEVIIDVDEEFFGVVV